MPANFLIRKSKHHSLAMNFKGNHSMTVRGKSGHDHTKFWNNDPKKCYTLRSLKSTLLGKTTILRQVM